MNYVFIWKNLLLNYLINLKHSNLSKSLYCKIHQMCKLLSKIELIIFFSVKIHVFAVKNFDMLKNKILKKQTKKH